MNIYKRIMFTGYKGLMSMSVSLWIYIKIYYDSSGDNMPLNLISPPQLSVELIESFLRSKISSYTV